ncbi:LysM peptidoglycan-binding domain-containing protein [Cypionkella sp.]|uniref:LysM peptidoglycan-binding domain-containing protein n=1 Tax=Cypionkella sp. TaxID=2811411 RepID=UPI00262AF968|nr:LysM peptidoglycan-binding domain-containing protein [Cypionkella sp.]MDB5665979.1 LysM peptidoglycan-binding protein [Cypionkella sp.]
MAGWNALSAGARIGIMTAAAAVVAVAGYFGFARGPEVAVPEAVQPVAVVAPAAKVAGVESAPLKAIEGDAPVATVKDAAPIDAGAADATEMAAPLADTAVADTNAADASAPDAAPVEAVASDAPTAAPSDAVSAENAAPNAVTDAAAPPSFDVVRVAPDGAAAVAGAAAPGAAVSLQVDGVEIAKAVANGQGKFAALFEVSPSPVARMLSLQAVGLDGVALNGVETVALAPTDVPELGSATGAADMLQAPAAVLIAPDGVKVLQPAGDVPAEVAANVAVETISYAPDGAVMLGGRAQGLAALRVYLDGTAVADVAAGSDGAWAATLQDVAAGIYTLRVDQLAPDGSVTSRFETPFKRETLEALAAASGAAAEPAEMIAVAPAVADAPAEAEAPGADAMDLADIAATDVVPMIAPAADVNEAAPKAADADVAKAALVTVTVQPGYTLWGIAQQNFGNGVMYVQVFEANRDKIKDADLIYPGQVFTIPKAE